MSSSLGMMVLQLSPSFARAIWLDQCKPEGDKRNEPRDESNEFHHAYRSIEFFCEHQKASTMVRVGAKGQK